MQRTAICVFFVLLAVARSSQGATFTGLGFSHGFFNSERMSLSDDGLVVVGTATLAGNITEAVRWTAASGLEGLGHFTGGGPWSEATGISADHSVIVGQVQDESGYARGARWTEAAGWERFATNANIDEHEPRDVSADGSVIVGMSWLDGVNREAFRWSEATGYVSLGNVPNGAGRRRIAYAVTPDGSVIVGQVPVTSNVSGFGQTRAFRWTEATGMVSIHDLPDGYDTTAQNISADGRVIVGTVGSDNGFRWTKETGMIQLPPIPNNFHSSEFVNPTGVSGNGSVIVGGRFIWDAQRGSRDLLDSFVSEFGLGKDLVGWSRLSATDVSADGHVVVGSGRNPEGIDEPWIAHLEPPPASVPEMTIPVTSAKVSPTNELLSFVTGGNTYTQSDLIPPTLVHFAGHPEASSSVGGGILAAADGSVPNPGSRAALLTNDFQLDTGVSGPAVDPTGATLAFSPPLVNGPGPDLVIFELAGATFGSRLGPIPDLFQVRINSMTEFISASAWSEPLSSVGIDIHGRDAGVPTDISQLENDSYALLRTVDDALLVGLAIDLGAFGVDPLSEVTTVQFGSFSAIDSIDPVLIMGINSAALSPRPGDFNSDGIVDGADFLKWQRGESPNSLTQSDLAKWEANFAASTVPTQPGDFDSDGDADGFDFLKWQRGESPNALSASDLVDWEANYGAAASLSANSSRIPEPSAWVMLILSLLAMVVSRRTTDSGPKR